MFGFVTPILMKDLKSNVALIGRVFLNRYSLFVINGFLLSATLLLYMQDLYEYGIIKALASNVSKQYRKYNSEDSILVGSLRLTNFLEERRNVIFEHEEIKENYAELLRPVSYDLMTANGSCGSYSMVLGSILHELGYKVRFAQMKVGDTWGGHIIIEAETAKGWVVLDPSFTLYFKRPDGSLANFADVHANWNYYKQQVPANYIDDYAYADVRYTNWTKIPVVMPALRGILNITIGKQATEDLSIRVYFIRKFRILYYIAIVLYVFSWYKIVRRYRRNTSAAKKGIAATLRNKPSKIVRRA
jgi:hypothetical protein